MRRAQILASCICPALLAVSVLPAASAQDVVGSKFAEARAALLASGWEPKVSSSRMKDGTLEKSFGEARSFKQAGFIEVEMCTGTGVNHCRFNYRRGQECLVVVTQGEWRPLSGSPRVIRTEPSCV